MKRLARSLFDTLPSPALVEAVFGGKQPQFDSSSRVMLIAPHPDDETLACGVVLQRAVRAGASIRVVYATDGDNNPWPQRFIERKWRLDANDRKRWGKMRRVEALAALDALGVPASSVRFLALPDQGLTNLLIHDCRSTLERLAAMLGDWRPTDLLVPAIADTHPDHNALAVMLRLILAEFSRDEPQFSVWSYAVHGTCPAFFDRAQEIHQSEAEASTKLRAIRCHKSQLKLSRRRFLDFAIRPERLLKVSCQEQTVAAGSVCSISRRPHTLHLDLRLSPRRIRHSKSLLFVLGHNGADTLRCVNLELPVGPSRPKMHAVGSNRHIGVGQYRGNGSSGELTIPIDGFSAAHPMFVKLERRSWFFDEAGWIEVPAAVPSRRISELTTAEPTYQFTQPTSPVKHNRKTDNFSQRWAVLFAGVLVWLALMLSANIDRPWIYALDFNGAVWSQSAHNILRAGLAQTSGASSGFYFGPLPIPAWGYYLHHPPLLHLLITGLFVLFGEHEWAARLLPIGCSLVSAILLWLLVRSCVGTRVATLSAAVFACLPMELRYGQMVNFEPCVMMLILGVLLCLRNWHVSGENVWRHGALGLVLVGLWVDWAMYIFVVALCVCWLGRSREGRRFARVLLLAALFSAAIYLIRIRLLRPDAWQNLNHALVVRLGTSGTDRFTEFQWIRKVFGSLVTHFLPIGWVLATAGAVIAFCAKHRDENLLWLFRACVCVVVMDALFVGAFQNDSYIHQYISFYFVAPVAIMAGIALDRLIVFFQTRVTLQNLAYVGELFACVILLAVGARGTLQTNELQRQFRILDYTTPEPPDLIPELGSAIRKSFPPKTHILCNFLPEYGPQFAYYAQRDILNNLSDYRFWRPYLNDSTKPIGAVVWMAPKASQDLIAKLPPGNKQFLRFGDLSFCFWRRNQPFAK